MARKKTRHNVGIDVSKKRLHLAIHGQPELWTFSNDGVGHKTLIKFLKKRGSAKVVIEVTGTYAFDLAMALHRQARIAVHYINPLVVKGFASIRLNRAKTDGGDARLLADLARSWEGPEWTPPPPEALELRSLTRRIQTLTELRTAEQNRRSALRATVTTSDALLDDITDSINMLTRRIERLEEAALELVTRSETLKPALELLTTTRGIGNRSGLKILGEHACMPRDLTNKQIVAMAGLDPRPNQSGTMDGRRRISKAGNKYLRAAMHMPAVNAVRHCPEVRAFHNVLVLERKKSPLVAYTAIARKLLVTIHAMLRTETPWNPKRFYSGKVPVPPNLTQGVANLSP